MRQDIGSSAAWGMWGKGRKFIYRIKLMSKTCHIGSNIVIYASLCHAQFPIPVNLLVFTQHCLTSDWQRWCLNTAERRGMCWSVFVYGDYGLREEGRKVTGGASGGDETLEKGMTWVGEVSHDFSCSRLHSGGVRVCERGEWADSSACRANSRSLHL